MKTLKNVFAFIFLFMIGCLLLTCSKDDDNSTATDQEVTFSINISNLKSSTDYSLADADKIVLTIQNSNGSSTKYTSYEVDIQQMNGIYYTKKLVLKTGNYKLTEFLVLGAGDSTIFAVPLTGTKEAQNVDNPLPVAFSVAKTLITTIPIEVVSTKNKIPEDFGLIRFPILEVKTFSFGIGVLDNAIGKLLSAKLVIFSGDYINIRNLDSALNVVTVKDGFSKYTLIIEKTGYETYSHTYSLDSLKKFKDSIGNSSLFVELAKDDETTVLDGDANMYHSVAIGTQIWMTENLKTTRYNDYITIPLNKDWDSWGNGSPGYCWYDNNEANSYGALYKWYAVNTGKLCPIGWHVSSEADWDTMINYLGGADVAGAKLRAIVNGHFYLAGGYAYAPYFHYMNEIGYWWTSTELIVNSKYQACYYTIFNSNTKVNKNYGYGNMGYSVRCVKD